ncbi:uncharacterized protein RMCN_1248 [Mycolicibacterium novocastrense]|uniref:Uncharacterized protein n=2 Tax=Mycolicibacterium novocastrense TaxID=59813 RepID=A0ABQ0KFA0_MYCNV|nr:uncharacterized protein RMCN_1248 [Mycolicibacterium novocastrense]
MVTCPNGHHNPPDFDLCGECGAPIEERWPEATAWYRTKWALFGAGAVVALMVLAAVVAIGRGSDRAQPAATTPTERQSISQWWERAHTPVMKLQDSIADARHSMESLTPIGLEQACQRMHDLAGVNVHTYLPAPTPELTSELAAAAEDAHAAAHMCLSAAAGSRNAYDGEFKSSIEQAERQLVHAQELVNVALLHDQ